jgi:hypothetical protein
MENPFLSEEYRSLIRDHLERSISFLLSRGMEFSFAADVRYLSSTPELPPHIKEAFSDISLFVISGYTFETTRLDNGNIRFEAGFGDENFGADVTIPLLAIKQLFVDDLPIVFNISSPVPTEDERAERSMKALLSNPENRKLFGKKKR